MNPLENQEEEDTCLRTMNTEAMLSNDSVPHVRPLFEESDDDESRGMPSESMNSFALYRGTPLLLEPKRVVLNCSLSTNDVFDCDENFKEPKWKRYEAHTGWKHIPLTEIGFADLPQANGGMMKSKFLKAGRSCNLKVKSGRNIRILSNSPYDVAARASWKPMSPRSNPGPTSLLDRYPPREQCNVNDAIDMLTTMKISKKIGFANQVEIMK